MIKCTFENGNEAALRHVTVDGIVVRDHTILLVRRAIYLNDGGKFCLPGGFLDRDETTEEGVIREIKEETGYTATSVKLFTVNDNPRRGQDHRQNVAFIFTTQVTGEPSEHDQESTEVTWFPLDKLPPASEMAFDHLSIIELYKKS